MAAQPNLTATESPAVASGAHSLVSLLLRLVPPAIWGGLIVAASGATAVVPPGQLNLVTLLIGCLGVLPVCWREIGPSWRVIRHETGLLALYGLLGFAGFQILWIYGLMNTSPVSAALLTPTLTIMVTLASLLLFGEGRSWLTLLASIVTVAGVLWIALEGRWDHGPWHATPGDFLILAANVSMCGYTILLRLRPSELSPRLFLLLTLAWGAVFSLPVAIAEDFGATDWREAAGYFPDLLYIGLLSNALAYLMWNKSVESSGSGATAMFLYAQPVFGILFAVLLMGAHILSFQIVGGALVVAGLALGWMSENRPPRSGDVQP